METGEKLASILQEFVDQMGISNPWLPDGWKKEMYDKIEEVCRKLDK